MRRNIDMLQGSLADKILLFALPLAATGILQQLFNAADVAVVGRFAGKEAMAAVGSNASLVSLLVNLFVGVSLGANVIISQCLGQGDNERVSRAVHTSIIVALIGGVVFAAVGETFVGSILRLLSVPDDVFGLSKLYLRIYLLGLPVIFLYDFESSIYRSLGDTRTPLVVLTVSGVVNVCLNLVFVVGLGMTVNGVALATVIANALSAAALFVLLCKTEQAVRIVPRALKVHSRELGQILKVGLPAGVQGAVFSLSNICVQSAINSLGTTIVAASSAAFYIEVLAYYVVNSFGQACTTFTGQNFGAKKYLRCKKILKYSLILDAVFTLSICGLILLFGRLLLNVFTTDPEVIETGYIRLIYIFSSYLFSLIGDIFSGYMRGFGMSLFPALAALFSICGVRIFWVYAIFPHYQTFPMLLIVYPISLFVQAFVMFILYLSMRKNMYVL